MTLSIDAQIISYLLWILFVPTLIIGMKYFLYSDLWVEYSPMTSLHNAALTKKISRSIQKINDVSHHQPTPSLIDDLLELLDDNGHFRDEIPELMAAHIDLKFLHKNCYISRFSLKNNCEFKLLFIPENNQKYFLTDKLLGKGESAKTFLAKNILTAEWVAVKRSSLKSKSRMIPNEVTVLSPSKEYNVLLENQYLLENKKLIGQLVKKDTLRKYIYTVMPLYSSKDPTKLPLEEKIHLSISLAKEINLLHSNGYLHNDLHLKNICWDGQNCHLIDFESMTRLNNFSHRYFYMTHSYFSHTSPEGLLGFNTRAKDIYAYGKILHELFIHSPIESEIKEISDGLTRFMLNRRISLNAAIEALNLILKNVIMPVDINQKNTPEKNKLKSN